ncbi:GntR family transcriptional regulator [Cryobacterium sp. Y50]|uniref:GntR family transcriptional regulator n=1 Tax=Cryobacterium sp. Y50 TaxID=2048286 RepID=UPI000CE43846|nr:GntR family transcriptional regulator [Cryobacterium sp. Y50]
MAAKYEEILKDLSVTIAEMSPGEKLPSEQQLADNYSVSGMTVRRALQVLTSAKRIVGIRGKGTYVAQPTVTKRMILTSFTDSMKAAGMVARAEVITASLELATPEVMALLGMPAGEQVLKIARLRYGDNTALCIDRTSLRASNFPGLLGSDLTGSLYELMLKRYGIELSRAESRISAVLPNAEDAALLKIPATMPCIRVASRSRTDDENIAESTVSLYRGDLYELFIEPESSPRYGGPAIVGAA